jgi:uncharacterized protein with GYD domain
MEVVRSDYLLALISFYHLRQRLLHAFLAQYRANANGLIAQNTKYYGKGGDHNMPTYILLIKWTEEGIKTVQDAPNRVERAHSMWKSAGGALKDFYFTFGRYDMIAIAEAPSDEAAAKLALKNGTYGMARVETLKAFPEAEGLEIIKGLP